jgi:hypothetical protein
MASKVSISAAESECIDFGDIGLGLTECAVLNDVALGCAQQIRVSPGGLAPTFRNGVS